MTNETPDYLSDPAWGIDARIEVANDDLLPLGGLVRIVDRFQLLDDPEIMPDALVYRLMWAFYPSARAGYQLPVGVESPDQLSPAERREVLKHQWATLRDQIEDAYAQHHHKTQAQRRHG